MFHPDDTLTMRLTVAEWNQIMGVLGKQPYEQVFALIAKINEQAAQQDERDGAGNLRAVGDRAAD